MFQSLRGIDNNNLFYIPNSSFPTSLSLSLKLPDVQNTYNLGGTFPNIKLIFQGPGIDPNESIQIQNACISAVNQGSFLISRICAETIKRNLNGEWFVFISNEGQEDFNFSLTRCIGYDYMVFTYRGRKFQINRLKEKNPTPIQITPDFPMVTTPVESTIKPSISLRSILQVDEVSMENLPPKESEAVMNSIELQPIIKVISQGKGINNRESNLIQSICLQAYQQTANPLIKVCADNIKSAIGGEWLVFISNEGDEDYNFSLSKCNSSDFMEFIIDRQKFQVCKVNGLS